MYKQSANIIVISTIIALCFSLPAKSMEDQLYEEGFEKAWSYGNARESYQNKIKQHPELTDPQKLSYALSSGSTCNSSTCLDSGRFSYRVCADEFKRFKEEFEKYENLLFAHREKKAKDAFEKREKEEKEKSDKLLKMIEEREKREKEEAADRSILISLQKREAESRERKNKEEKEAASRLSKLMEEEATLRIQLTKEKLKKVAEKNEITQKKLRKNHIIEVSKNSQANEISIDELVELLKKSLN